MKPVPRILPLLAVAIGGVLAMKAISGLEFAPDFLKQARAFAEDAGPGDKSKTADAALKPAVPPVVAKAPPPVCAMSAADLAKEAGLSPSELRVLQGLQARRGELDQRSTDIDTQMAVMAAAEAKIDAKLKALTALKGDVQGLLGQVDAKKAEEEQRLVRVYSAMKPAEAAAIFVQLDDKVRVPVAAQMKERVLAAILAKMPPVEARKLTERLAARYAAADALTAKADAAAKTPAPAAAAKTPAAAPAKK